MKDLKSIIVFFSMTLVFIIVVVKLWDFRAEELKKITDYIVEANFEYQKEQKESDFIKLSSNLENKLTMNNGADLFKFEIQEIKTLALSSAPYDTLLSLEQKMILLDCLEKINIIPKNSKQCTLDYAKQKVVKGL